MTFYKIQVEVQVEAQVELNETEKKVLYYLQKENLSSKDLVDKLGLKSLSGALKNAIKHLLELKLIQYTIPNKPKSKNIAKRIFLNFNDFIDRH